MVIAMIYALRQLVRGTAAGAISRLALLLFFVASMAVPVFGAGGDKLRDAGDTPQAGKQEAKASVVDGDGRLIVTGYRNLAGLTDDDYWTVKFNPDGTVAWRASYNRAGGSDQATAIAVDSNNDAIVTGFAWNGSNFDIYTVKYRGSDGAKLWENTYNAPAGGNDIGTAIAVDGLNNVYVGGSVQNASGNEDYIVLKFGVNGPNPDGTPLWIATWNGTANGTDKLAAIATGPGGVAVTGQSWNGTDFDVLTIKYDYAGTKLWENRDSSAGTNADAGRKVRVDGSGNVVVAASVNNGTNVDIYTAKYNGTNGALLWSATYNGPTNMDDEPTALALDGGGNVYVTGYATTLTGNEDLVVIRYDSTNGTKAWDKLYDSGGGGHDFGTDIVLDAGGNVYVGGYTLTGAGTTDMLCIKYQNGAASAGELWHTAFNGTAGKSDKAVGLGIKTTDNEFVVVVGGWSDVWTAGASDYDYWQVVLDAGSLNSPGNLTATVLSNTSVKVDWTDNSTNEDGFRIERKLTSEGIWAEVGTVGANVTTFTDTGLTANSTYYYRVRSYNALNGSSNPSDEISVITLYVNYLAPTWNYVFNSSDNSEDYAEAIAVGPDNNPVVTGYSLATLTGFDYYTVKLDHTTGALLWSERYNDVDSELDIAKSVVVDGSNTAIVTGYSSLYYAPAARNINSVFTLKYPAAGGIPLWEGQYNGPGGIDDRARAIATAVDGSNNVAVVGYGKNAANNDDIYLLKYAATPPLDGFGKAIPAWSATPYDGGGNDYPSAVAFDKDGNIVITGYRHNGINYDIYTAKYNGATGVKIWDHILDGAGHGDDYGQSLAVDAVGNVYVTGSTRNAAGNDDIILVKYDGKAVPTASRVIWQKSYDGTTAGNPNADDKGITVKYDLIDDTVVVAGTTLTGTGDHDFIIIRYSSAGNVVWQKVHLRPSSDDYATAMAMDVSGNVSVVGYTGPASGLTTDAMAVKFDYAGNLLAATIYNGAANGYDQALAVTVNSLGETLVAGYTTNATGNADYLVFKGDGTPLQASSPFTASPFYTKADLAWTDTSTGEDGFTIERQVGNCTSSNPWQLLTTTAANTTAYSDTGLNVGEEYCYRVRPFKSGQPDQRWIERDIVLTSPPPPSVVTPVAANTTTVNLTWQDNTTGETGFRIFRCTGSTVSCSAADYAEIGSVASNVTTYSDTGVTAATTYTYKVLSYKTADWQSQFSTPASATTPTPTAPTGLTATRGSEGQIDLAWSDSNNDESGFKIERCTGSGCSTFTQIDTVAASATSYSDIVAVQPDTLYRYQIRAYKTSAAGWNGPYSGVAEATTTSAAPSLTSATAADTTTVSLAWTDTAGSETGYNVERCLGTTCAEQDYSVVVLTAPSATSVSDASACNSTTYTYRVRAVNQGLSRGNGGTWSRKVPLAIANFQPYFQTKVVIPYDADMKADFTDIRFYDETTQREIPYWIESRTNSTTATFWIKTGGFNTISLYYGNGGATGAGNGPLVFELFDGFASAAIDTSKWTTSGAYYSQTGGEFLSSGGPGSWSTGMYSVANFSRPFVFEVNHYRSGGQYMMPGIKSTTADVSYTDFAYAAYPIYDGGGNRLAVYEDGNSRGDNKKAISSDVWQYFRFEVLPTTGANYYHGTSSSDATSFYASTYSTAPSFKVGFANYNQVFKLDNARVRKFAAPEPTVTLGEEAVFGGTFPIMWDGLASNTRSVTTPTPMPPSGFTASRGTEVQIDLAWTDTTSDETGFRIYRCAGAGCSVFSKVGSDLPANTTSFKDTGLTPGTSYTYKVAAFKTASCGWELESVTSTAQTTVLPPAAFAVSPAVTTGCEDIRATESDGTLLSQWVQQLQCNTTGTRIWQKVSSIPVGTKTLYYYYGNTTAPSVDNGDATFEFFDDFTDTAINGAKWTQTLGSAGNFTVQNGTLRGNNSSGRLVSTFKMLNGMLATFKVKTTTLAANTHMVGGVYNGTYDYFGISVGPSHGGYNLYGEWITAVTTTSVPANNMGYSIYSTDGATTTIQGYNWDTGAWYISPMSKSYSINNKPLGLGLTYYGDYYGGQAYQTDWYWVLVRKLAAVAPTATAGTKEYGPFTLGGATFAVRIPLTVNHTATGAAALSNYQAVLPLLDTTPLAVDRITLAWSDNSGSETGFGIERCTGAGCSNFVQIDTSAANTTSYVDRGVDAAQTYCYRIKTLIPTGDSAYSDVVCKSTSTPAPPAGLVTAVSGTRVDLSWTDTTTNEDGFQIERCEGLNCDFTTLDSGFPVTIPQNATATVTYSDTTACAGTYMYRVKSIKPWVTGWPATYTAAVPATLSDPQAPSAFTATAQSEVSVVLGWADNTSDETGFKIERCTGTGCTTFSQIATVAANVTSYTDYGRLPNTTYRYRVRAYKGGGCGWDTPYSAEQEVATTVPLPTGLTLTTPSSTQVAASWTDTTFSETSFKIERCQDAGCSTFSEVGSVSAGVTSYTDSSVCSGTSYTYQVRPVNEGFSSAGGGCWSRRAPLTIANFQPDFLVKLTIPYDADMQADFNDLRFIDQGTGGELPYWIESKTNGATATLWLKTGKTASIYLYYGNPSALAVGSQSGVFGSGLMAYFPFNENAGTTTGTTKDFSGAGNDLTMNGFSAPYGVVSGGPYGNALSLNGGGAWANRAAPNVPTGSVATVEAWIYPKVYADASYNGIVSWSSRGCNGLGFALSIQNSGRPSMPTWCNDYVPGSGATATLNAWNHVAAVLNGQSATLYVNGQQVGATTLPYLPNLSSVNLAVGVLDYPGRYFNGLIDEVRIYNRALTAQEITSRYAAAIPTVSLGAEEQAGGCYTSDWLYTGQPSATKSITTPTIAAPTGFSATRGSESQINLTWTDASNDETNFVIERCSGATCDFSGADTIELPAGPTSYNDVGLLPDTTYRYRLHAKRTASCTSYSAYNTNGIVSASTTVLAPTSLTASASSSTSVTLRWTDNSPSDTGFRIERCMGNPCSNFSLVGYSPGHATSYEDTGVCPGTAYTYQIKAVNVGLSSGGGGSWTRRKPITIANFQPNFQTKMTVAYDAGMKADFSDIRFFDPATNQELPYWIEKKTDSSTATVWVKTRTSSTIHLYYGNPNAESIASGALVFDFFDDFTDNAIDTTKWTVTDGTGFSVSGGYLHGTNVTGRLTSKTSYSPGVILDIKAKTTSFAIDGQIIGGFSAGSYNNVGWLEHPAYVHFINNNSYTAKGGTPTTTANMLYSMAVIDASWVNMQATNFDTGVLYWNAGNVNNGVAAEPIVLGRRYDTDASNDQPYATDWDWIRVRKYAATEPSATVGAEEQSAGYTFTAGYTGPASATATATTPAPVAPGVLTVTPATDTSLLLGWGDPIPDETRFVIYGCNNGDCSSATQIATVAGGTAIYTHPGLTPSIQYCYRVKAEKTAACTTGWEALYTNIACGTAISAQPQTLTATPLNAFTIRLNWADMASDEEGYEIEVKAWNDKWVKTATVGANVTTYVDAIGIEPLKSYTYRVRAYRGSDKSPYSNTASATTQAYVPGDSNCK
ncbi:Protein of unknown function DUF2341 [Geobacter metallireducens RCH3]|uniref:Fibronectin type III repeat, DUF2341 repeat and LamG-like domain protein n=1 Tax=Geobacter metallireducens (strain ATCC 53774 / DSM 7210 / GS-15) TaxID=269799 RepID=Q39ST0_GEOMG|nr:fibronectin type III repeat, DUF2341 repeat and LamG-like domain protein [Geobacter metallireducens GS-15]EHP87813.1 Protein of unknown function DUF2341 [Geobacter metallireducens RCH3]